MQNATSLALIDKPKEHDIEAVRPHQRKHMRPHKLLIKGSEVTIQGTSLGDAKRRFSKMTGGEVAFHPVPTKGIRKGEVSLIMAARNVGKSTFTPHAKRG